MAASWSQKIVDEAGLEKIHAAVVRAESRASAEIVPMIVRSSSPMGHVFWLLFALLLLVMWAVTPSVRELAPEVPAAVFEAGALILAAALAGVLSPLTFVQRHLTSAGDQAASVNHRALLEFYLSRINDTEAHTGVLIFVSLLERRAAVVVDEKVKERFPNEKWSDVIAPLLAKTRAGQFADGMDAAISHLGVRLAEAFPRQSAKNTNELGDLLIVKE